MVAVFEHSSILRPRSTSPRGTGAPSGRSRALNLLQILGAFSVVAFHTGSPYAEAGWIAVESFFVIAGINMVAALNQGHTLGTYVWARTIRLGPELLFVWVCVLLATLIQFGSPGMFWFLVTCPLFLHNLSLPFFQYDFPSDWLYAPLWFVGTLFQLQLLLFICRRWILRVKTSTFVLLLVVVGVSSRLLVAWLANGPSPTLPAHVGNILYFLPFTHMEAIGLGFLIGRGSLVSLGRLLPGIALATLSLGISNVILSGGVVKLRAFGFGFPLGANYSHVWGYTVLAFAMASLCAKDSLFVRWVEQAAVSPRLDNLLNRFASLTYSAYVFHGLAMATGINGSYWLARTHAPASRLLLLAITIVEAFLLSWLFHKATGQWRRRLREKSLRQHKTENAEEPIGQPNRCADIVRANSPARQPPKLP